MDLNDKKTDEKIFFAGRDTKDLGFIETNNRIFNFDPPLNLVEGRQYRIQIYLSGRVVVQELINEVRWNTLVDKTAAQAIQQ